MADITLIGTARINLDNAQRLLNDLERLHVELFGAGPPKDKDIQTVGRIPTPNNGLIEILQETGRFQAQCLDILHKIGNRVYNADIPNQEHEVEFGGKAPGVRW